MSEAPIHKIPLFRAIAQKIQHVASLGDCFESYDNRWNWTRDHYNDVKRDAKASLDYLIDNHLPSGSGIDSGVSLDSSSTARRLVFNLSFHHMDENGFYDGWTDHQAIVTADLTSHEGMALRITGRNQNDIKDYLHETIDYALTQGIDPYEFERKQREAA